jgi:hypothetical protein
MKGTGEGARPWPARGRGQCVGISIAWAAGGSDGRPRASRGMGGDVFLRGAQVPAQAPGAARAAAAFGTSGRWVGGWVFECY